MKDRVFRLGTEALWVVGGQIGVAAGGLLGIKILTHVLNPFEFGRLSIANTIILLVGIIFFGPLGQGLMRYWSISKERHELNVYVHVSRKYINLLMSLVIVLAFVAAAAIHYSRWRDWGVILILAMIGGAFTGWCGIRLSILMAARKRKNVALINAGSAFAKPILAAVLIFFMLNQAEIAILGYLITACISIFFAEYVYRRIVPANSKRMPFNDKKVLKHDLGKEILAFSYPFFIWGIFGWVHQSCDRWALITFQGANVVGAYAMISQLSVYPLVFGSSFLSTFFLPVAYERAGELHSKNAITAANKIVFTMAGLFVVGAVVLILFFSLFHRQLVLLVSNQEYVEFSYLLPGLTTSWSFYYLGLLLSGFGFLAKKPRLYLPPILSSGILTATATFYLASMHGPLGVIWGLGIGGLFYAAWCLIIAKQLIMSRVDY